MDPWRYVTLCLPGFGGAGGGRGVAISGDSAVQGSCHRGPGLLLEIADANHVVGLPEIDRKGFQAMYVVQAAEPIFLGRDPSRKREKEGI